MQVNYENDRASSFRFGIGGSEMHIISGLQEGQNKSAISISDGMGEAETVINVIVGKALVTMRISANDDLFTLQLNGGLVAEVTETGLVYP